jgi:hypothetical protein
MWPKASQKAAGGQTALRATTIDEFACVSGLMVATIRRKSSFSAKASAIV